MTLVMPLALLKAAPSVYGSISVVSSGAAGWIIAGGVTGVIVAGVAVVTLILAVIAGNARKRSQWRGEMAAERAAGRAELAPDLDAALADASEWRRFALQLLAGNHTAPPPAPVTRRRRSTPTLAPTPPDDEESQ